MNQPTEKKHTGIRRVLTGLGLCAFFLVAKSASAQQAVICVSGCSGGAVATTNTASQTTGPQVMGNASGATPTAVGADGRSLAFWLDTVGRLHTVCDSGCGGSGGTSLADNANFTAGSTSGTPAMGFYHSTVDTVTDAHSAALAIDSKRNLFTVIRDAADNARGVNVTAGNALTVDASATTQPISAASLPLPSGAATLAKQPALGTAGTPSADVITIQGATSMTKLLVTPDANSAVNVGQIGGTTIVTAGVGGLQAIGGPVASGASNARNPVKVGGVFNTTQPTVTDGQIVDLQATNRGALIIATGTDIPHVICDSGCSGGGGGASSTYGAAFPSTGTAIGVKDSTGTNMVGLNADASGNLDVKVNVALPAGTNVIGHTINDTGSTTAVTGNVTVVQSTASNLKVDLSGTAANSTAIKVDGSAVTQPVSGTVACSNCTGGGVSVNEDTASANADPGTPAYAVRQDSISTTTTTDGDYQPLKVDSAGRLYTTGSGGTFPVTAASGSIASGAIASGAVASGAFASGSISDGAEVTLGAKADAKSTATDTTAVTVMSVLKEISAMEQAPASRVVTSATASNLKAQTTAVDSGGTSTTDTTAHAEKVLSVDASGTAITPTTLATHDTTLGTITSVTGSVPMGRASAAAPTDVSTDGDAVALWALKSGALAVEPTYAGVLATTGNGGVGTGVARVTIASDSTGTLAVTQSTASNLKGQMALLDSGGTSMSDTTSHAVKVELVNPSDGSTITPSVIEPCRDLAKTPVTFSISSATTTQLIAASSSNKNYICSINIVVSAADNIALVEDDTSACASPTAGMAGGTTAATGWNFAANGGLTFGNGTGSVFITAATNRYTCFITSGTAQVSGSITYVQSP